MAELLFIITTIFIFYVLFSVFSSSGQDRHNKKKNKNEDVKYNYGADGKSVERIISCPFCDQKTRIKLPFNNNVIKCKSCSSRFKIRIDSSGHVYITNLSQPADSFNIDNIDDCLSILGIGVTATGEEIKAAYKIRIAEYHPDKVQKLGDKIKKVAEIEAKKINAAYLKLKKEYDL